MLRLARVARLEGEPLEQFLSYLRYLIFVEDVSLRLDDGIREEYRTLFEIDLSADLERSRPLRLYNAQEAFWSSGSVWHMDRFAATVEECGLPSSSRIAFTFGTSESRALRLNMCRICQQLRLRFFRVKDILSAHRIVELPFPPNFDVGAELRDGWTELPERFLDCLEYEGPYGANKRTLERIAALFGVRIEAVGGWTQIEVGIDFHTYQLERIFGTRRVMRGLAWTDGVDYIYQQLKDFVFDNTHKRFLRESDVSSSDSELESESDNQFFYWSNTQLFLTTFAGAVPSRTFFLLVLLFSAYILMKGRTSKHYEHILSSEQLAAFAASVVVLTSWFLHRGYNSPFYADNVFSELYGIVFFVRSIIIISLRTIVNLDTVVFSLLCIANVCTTMDMILDSSKTGLNSAAQMLSIVLMIVHTFVSIETLRSKVSAAQNMARIWSLFFMSLVTSGVLFSLDLCPTYSTMAFLTSCYIFKMIVPIDIEHEIERQSRIFG